MMKPNDINDEFARYLFEHYDNQFSDIGKYTSFDPYLISEFLKYLSYAGGGIATIDGVKRFIDFLKNRTYEKREEQDIKDKLGKKGDGRIEILKLEPGNIILMSGIGSERPVIEACDTKPPLFIIQRGYILILSGITIHINYDQHELVKEYKAPPAFLYDGTVDIERTSSCDETPGLFRVMESIYITKSNEMKRGR